MANLDKLKNDPKKQLLEHISDVRCVMLGSPDHEQHMQPMSPQVDKETGKVWFFAQESSDLVKTLGASGGNVHMCVVEKDYQACLRGDLVVNKDPAMIEKFWSKVVAAWFKGGKSDPDLTMLCFDPHDASIWASDGNPIAFAYEIAKANLKDNTPDVGGRASVNMH